MASCLPEKHREGVTSKGPSKGTSKPLEGTSKEGLPSKHREGVTSKGPSKASLEGVTSKPPSSEGPLELPGKLPT
jgi:hypothetical protein